LLTGAQNDLEHGVSLSQNLVIPEPQNIPSKPVEVSGSLIVSIRSVLSAVGFDDESSFYTGEIDDERADCFLPLEFVAAEAAVPKVIPKPVFGVRRLAPQPSRVRIDFADRCQGRP
jgi:hypothetical protein